MASNVHQWQTFSWDLSSVGGMPLSGSYTFDIIDNYSDSGWAHIETQDFEVMARGTVGSRVGNDLIDRAYPDGASQICFIDRSLEFQMDGKIVSWDIYAGRAGEQRLQVWRPTTTEPDVNKFTLICENTVSSPTAGDTEHFVLPETDHCREFHPTLSVPWGSPPRCMSGDCSPMQSLNQATALAGITSALVSQTTTMVATT
jgi:hypothetical protein